MPLLSDLPLNDSYELNVNKLTTHQLFFRLLEWRKMNLFRVKLDESKCPIMLVKSIFKAGKLDIRLDILEIKQCLVVNERG